MSAIGYRDWEIWQNNRYFETLGSLDGQFVLAITPSLMANQTVQFFFELTESVRLRQSTISGPVAPYLSWDIYPRMATAGGPLYLYKVGQLDTSASLPEVIAELLDDLRAWSLCVDFPLTCNNIEFEIPPGQANTGKVFVAARAPLGRGLGFEVEERGVAADNLRNHSAAYRRIADPVVTRAVDHYLTGLTLLGLEDSFSGLVDAAFMQFYQGCETLLLQAPRETVNDANKRIAANPLVSKPMDLQVIVAHVWKARHNYFGHRSGTTLRTSDEVFQVAKQVLVARWLCRFLIDLQVGAATFLCREMRFYHRDTSEGYTGTLAELETTFRLPGVTGERVQVFDQAGTVVDIYLMV